MPFTDAKPRRRRVWPGLLFIAVITAIAAVAAYVILSEPSQSGTMGSVGSRITGVPTSSATVPPTTSSAAPAPPPLPHDFVAQGMPESFAIECGGETLVSTSSLTTTVRQERVRDYSTMTVHYDLVPPGDTIALVQDDQVDWAAKPGSDAGTVSIWGHANANPRMAFNPIAEYRGDQSDCQATIEVPGGTLGYGFVRPYTVTPKSEQFNKSAELSAMPDKAGKLLVSTCSDADSEIIWEFRLRWSRAR